MVYKTNDESYAKCETIEEFRQFCKDGFWENEDEFFNDTKIKFEDIENKWFIIINNRIYLKED